MNGEDAGSTFGQGKSQDDASTKKALSEIGKRLKNGERDALLREWGVTGGRAYQHITAAFDFIEEEGL